MKQVINLTGHALDVRIRVSGFTSQVEVRLTIPTHGIMRVRRWDDELRAESTPVESEGATYYVPISTCSFVPDTGMALPPPQPDVVYCVSAIVANTFPDRADLVTPATSRDANNVVYCTGFTRVVTNIPQPRPLSAMVDDQINLALMAAQAALIEAMPDRAAEIERVLCQFASE